MTDPDDNPHVELGSLSSAEVSDDVKRLREEEEEHSAAHAAVAASRASAHIAACRIAIQQLASRHSELLDKTDLDPTEKTRVAAVWLMAGRCLGLAETLLVQVEAGICIEALATARSLHEANMLLRVFIDDKEHELLALWLEDEGKHAYPKASEARRAHARFEERFDAAMEEAGHEPTGGTAHLSAHLYDLMSRSTHNRRSACLDSYWEEGRRMAYGRHPDPFRCAFYALWADGIVVDCAQAVGDALRSFYGPDFYEKHVKEFVHGVEVMEEVAPVDQESIRAEVSGD